MLAQVTYRPDIDGLRAVAILGVVAGHIGLPFATGGFTGVDVFFVISGFLITQLLVKELDATGRISIGGFYARRVRRIIPALTLVVGTSLLLGNFLLPPFGERIELSQSAIWASAFVANEFFRLATEGYFAGPSELKPLLHLWSLSVEEQFYVVWPLILFGIAFLASAKKRLTYVSASIVAISLCSFALSEWLMYVDYERAFYFIGSRAWELGVGAWLALRRPSPAPAAPWFGGTCSAFGLLLIACGFFWLHPGIPFPGVAALPPVLGTALVIYGNSLAPAAPVSRLLSAKPAVLIGLLSYSWYLWHWPLLAFARTWRLDQADVSTDGALVLVALALAWLTYKYVENPIRYGYRAAGRGSGPALATGGAALATIAAAGVGLVLWGENAPRSLTEQAAYLVANDRSPHQSRCLLSPNTWTHGALRAADCSFGSDKKPPSIALWGDSHADAWAPLLDQALGGGTFVQLSMNTCPPLLGNVPAIPGVYSPAKLVNCREFNEEALDILQSPDLAKLKGVLLSARWAAYAGAPNISVFDDWIGYFNHADRSANDAVASLKTGLAATLKALAGRNRRVLILLSQPEFAHPLYRCFLIKLPASCGVDRAQFDRHRASVKQAIEEVAAEFESVRVVDPAAYFCDERYCHPFLDGVPSLYDDDHVSASAARRYAVQAAGDIAWLLQSGGEEEQAGRLTLFPVNSH